ncbi:MAG TPA: tRNA lysidine(34) synthetase TilS [bacterium]|nr:tRNA lysidine(34) synthetase TilS [bacterium]
MIQPQETINSLILDAAEKFGMFPKDSRVLVAVSGGPDSVCLVHALNSLKNDLSIEPAVAHFNHNTRNGGSDEDEAFVKELADSIGLDFFAGNMRDFRDAIPESGSPEAVWRAARHGFLSRTASENGFHRIALGHNSGDRVETVLMRLIRGTSPTGICGMGHCDPPLVRPLLDASRTEIMNYCESLKLEYRTDPSNNDTAYLRNRVRHRLIPFLEKEFNPKAASNISRFSSLLERDFEFLDELARLAAADALISRDSDRICLSLPALDMLPDALLSRVLRDSALRILGTGGWRLDHRHIDAMLELVKSPGAGKELSLPVMLRLIKKYESVEILLMNRDAEIENDPRAVFRFSPARGEVFIPREFGITLECDLIDPVPEIAANTDVFTAYFDADTLGGELSLRFRKDGDSFHPLGAAGTKKLKDFFIDSRLDRDMRDGVPLLVARDQIAWVIGHRIDHRFRVTRDTAKVLKISVRTP